MLWELDVYPAAGQPDILARRLAADAADLHLAADLPAAVAQGYLLEGRATEHQLQLLARQLLADPVVERAVAGKVGSPVLCQPPPGCPLLVHVLPKPGVMDPVAESALRAIRDLRVPVDNVRTLRKYWLAPLPEDKLKLLCTKVLANEAIEQVVVGPLRIEHLDLGTCYRFQPLTVPLRTMDDAALLRTSRQGQLSLSLAEMQAIQQHFVSLCRDPFDVELETLAQTWSEHCSHKTLRGSIDYRDEHGRRHFQNLLKETIFAATHEIRRTLGPHDGCVSVFEDNAGVVRFDDLYNLAFKVETHNHPSAIEPYGGANTGLGGVIRDALGTGLGARPIGNTDVFCFAPPDLPPEDLPPGVLHPRRVMRGVVAGVRDYGNRMGIPTVNGAIYFDRRYLGNPLVFCGNVGLLPRDKSVKRPQVGDYIVVIGGRTGRDGIHGATFSSIELDSRSEQVSGGAVQIGNAITEKMVTDVVLQARDRGLFNAITDCGAGGLSSAIGEMGERIGASVHLERVPLKYAGLSYTEIWISEAQERMVLAVPPQRWEEFSRLCACESVEATHIGTFEPTGRLQLYYQGHQVADLSMEFLHQGRPPIIREAAYAPAPPRPQPLPDKLTWDYTPELLQILGSLNVASKEWVIRQYDHEVQGGSVVKPLVGARHDGPSDAAVIRPVLSSRRGVVIGCGMNPLLGDLDTGLMAAAAIDEAVRNCVAAGADPARIALLDNFCWGNTDRPEQLGALVRAALACHDTAIALGTPFISGKDSLNNEFHYQAGDGTRQSIIIPPTLLISALGQIDDVRQAVTMDLKEPGNFLYLVGLTLEELGGSHFNLVQSLSGGNPPAHDAPRAKKVFAALHAAMAAGLVRACHDLSEGGLAVAAAEMALAGDLGARLFLAHVPQAIAPDEPSKAEREALAARSGIPDLHPLATYPLATAALLFSESNSRFVCEVHPDDAVRFETALAGLPCALIGEVTDNGRLEIVGLPTPTQPDHGMPYHLAAPLVVDAELAALRHAWQEPLRCG